MTGSATSRVLHVLRDPPLDGPTNMARDEHLLYSERLRPAVVRIYGWAPPTISLGCFQRYADLGQLPAELRELVVVRRPTGGGAILHDREVTYCLVIDETCPPARQRAEALYRLVHNCWREALLVEREALRVRREASEVIRDTLHEIRLAPESLPFPSPRGGPFFCFEEPGRTDLIVGGAKLLGSAQRRLPDRVLQHGSLLLGQRFAAHPGANLGEPPAETVERWIGAFLRRLAGALGLELRPAAWSSSELADVTHRCQHYSADAWTRRR